MMAADLRALAERLQPALKPSKGPTPEVPHIMAAILLARDCTLGGRAACRLVPGVYEEAAHSRVAKLAVKVRALLDEEPSPLPPESSPPPAQPPLPPAPPLAPPVFASERPQEEEQASSWDLPPLVATLEPPSAMSLSASPVSYTHLRAHETKAKLVCRLLLEKKNTTRSSSRRWRTSARRGIT